MKSALGVLKWSPEQFWAASFCEYQAAMRGLYESQTGKRWGDEKMTRNELLDMMAKEKQTAKARGNIR